MVIIFRQQDLSPAELVGIAKRFGALSIYPFVRGMDDHPEIVEVVKHAHEKVNFGGCGTRYTYLEEPPLGSLLYAKEIPPLVEIRCSPTLRRHDACPRSEGYLGEPESRKLGGKSRCRKNSCTTHRITRTNSNISRLPFIRSFEHTPKPDGRPVCQRWPHGVFEG